MVRSLMYSEEEFVPRRRARVKGMFCFTHGKVSSKDGWYGLGGLLETTGSIETQGEGFCSYNSTKSSVMTSLESLDANLRPSRMFDGGREGAGGIGSDNEDVSGLWTTGQCDFTYEDIHAESLVGVELIWQGDVYSL